MFSWQSVRLTVHGEVGKGGKEDKSGSGSHVQEAVIPVMMTIARETVSTRWVATREDTVKQS